MEIVDPIPFTIKVSSFKKDPDTWYKVKVWLEGVNFIKPVEPLLFPLI